MRRLLVLRHAKAASAEGGARDLDRPLTDGGRRDAAASGGALATRPERPDLVLASPALRVRQTLEAFLPAAGVALEPRFEDVLYGAGVAELAQRVRALPPEARTVLLVGHNPAVEELVGRLTGAPGPGMSTSTLACLEVDGEWADLEDGAARLAFLVRPPDPAR